MEEQMILLAALLSLSSCLLCILLTPLFRDAALRIRCVDEPDSERKVHRVATPRIGGVPVIAAYAGSLGLLYFLQNDEIGRLHTYLAPVWALITASLGVFVIGLVDDLIGLSPRQKLAGQALAAAVVCWIGLQIGRSGGFTLSAEWGIPLTMIWLVGCSNAFNLIDGADGVAAGIGLLGAITTMLAGIFYGDPRMVLATAPLVGALLGFLRYNFNPASIFLGDCGSLWIGFMLGCCGVMWSEKPATSLGALAPAIALSIPLLDMTLSIARRFVSGKAIFAADRGHIHHRLLARGLTPRRVATLLYAACAFVSVLSLILSTSNATVAWVVLIVCAAAGRIGFRYLGYRELAIAAKLLSRINVGSHVQSELTLNKYEQTLRLVHNPEECWLVVQEVARDFGCTQVLLRMCGRNFQQQLSGTKNGHYVLRIPLSDSEFVNLTHECEPRAMPIGALANTLQRTLSAKAAEMAGPGCSPVQAFSITYGQK